MTTRSDAAANAAAEEKRGRGRPKADYAKMNDWLSERFKAGFSSISLIPAEGEEAPRIALLPKGGKEADTFYIPVRAVEGRVVKVVTGRILF